MSNRIERRVGVLLCILVGFALLGNTATAQSKVGQEIAQYLTWINSPRAVGMGGCSVNLVYEQAGLYNPGALGLYHLTRFASLSFPGKVEWVPGIEGLNFGSYGVSGGLSTKSLRKSKILGADVSVGLAYFRRRLDSGSLYEYSYEPMGLGIFVFDESCHSYSFGIGIEQYARLGLGYTYKVLKQQWSDSRSGGWERSSDGVGDFGVLFEVPFSGILPRRNGRSTADSMYMSYDFTVSMAYVILNMGTLDYDGGPYWLPQTPRAGLSCYGALRQSRLTLGSVRLSYEEDADSWIKRYGTEIGIMDIFAIRLGRIEDTSWDAQPITNTVGWGISLRGILALLRRTNVLRPSNALISHISRNLDLSYDYASHRVNSPFESD
ncbi:MAG: hypothetical protein KAT85_01155, partial [candidate division Zixibacteria bacterium]|nr:hypothetical protein [candidate division Zixibacteria bacterium]